MFGFCLTRKKCWVYFCHCRSAEGGFWMRSLESANVHFDTGNPKMAHITHMKRDTFCKIVQFIKYTCIQTGNNQNIIRIYIYIYTNLLFKSLSKISLSFESHMMFPSPRLSMVSSFNILNVNSPCFPIPLRP